MRNLFDRILNPDYLILLVYGLLSFYILIRLNLNASFDLFYSLDLIVLFIDLLIVILVGYLISKYIDRKNNTSIKKYFILSLVLLILIWIIAEPIREWQIEKSQGKAELIINSLEVYKDLNKVYPETLEKLEQELKLKLPKRTSLRTYYFYEKGSQSYDLSFYSYYGYIATYDKEKKKWGFYD